MPQPLVPGFPYSYSIGVMSALWTVILGRITFKTIKPAPSLVPSTYGSPQCRKKSLIPMLFFILTEGQLQTHFVFEFLLEGVQSRAQAVMFMNPRSQWTHIKCCSDSRVAPPSKIREKYSPPPLKGEGREGHSRPWTALSRVVSFIGGLRWCAPSLGSGDTWQLLYYFLLWWSHPKLKTDEFNFRILL